MQVKPYPNGIFGAATYLVYDENSLDGAIVDATSSLDDIKKYIDEKKINLKYILITHGHFDHVYELENFKQEFPNALVLANKEDLPLLNQIQQQCSMAGVENIKVPCIDGLIDENSKNLTLGDEQIKIIHTKGHSKGGICYLIKDILFSGDTLFLESIGRCDLFGGDFNEIKQSIVQKLFALDDNITVYPGHGDSTSIGHEKKYNDYFGKKY